MTNEELVRNACQVIWTDGDVSRIGEFYAENFQANYPMTNWGTGLEGEKNLALEIRAAFPDYRERIDELIDASDRIVVRLTIQGTHLGDYGGLPATGKSVEFTDVTICRIEHGRIVEQSGLSDLLSLFVQLGLIELPGSA
jgi:steroid delta-isomerase-like uncharacterized protein